MNDRSDRIPMPLDQPRCDPVARPCVARGRCVRYKASIPQGAPLRDYTANNEPNAGTVLCDGYAHLQRWAAAPISTRRLHPPLNSEQ